jgi:hypothetical protein
MADLRLVVAALAVSTAFSGVSNAEAADAWTCIFRFSLGDTDQAVRFEIANSDLTETKGPPQSIIPAGTHYRILQNNDYGLVATFSYSGALERGKDPYVGAISVVINKMTGQLYLAEATTTKDESIGPFHASGQGKCLHD